MKGETRMVEYLYDESIFPEYNGKLERNKRLALSALQVGIIAYFIALPMFAFVLFPASTLPEKIQIAVGLLFIPLFFGGLAWFVYRFKRLHPLRITWRSGGEYPGL